MSSHTNSQFERVSIEPARAEAFEGQPILILHEDGPLNRTAPMLLDHGTAAYLVRECIRLYPDLREQLGETGGSL